MISSSKQFLVLGSPISHSQSPTLHRAAYRALGLDWGYDALEVKSGELESFFATRPSHLRGASLTMPLKREVFPFLDEFDEVSRVVGAVNTVLLDDTTARGFNTDVYGAERMIRESFGDHARRALIIGAGATAGSVMAALVHCGVRDFAVAARSPTRAHEVVELGDRLGVGVTVDRLDADPGSPDLVVSTLPGDVDLSMDFSDRFRAGVPLIDIAYDPWPTTVARHWQDAGGKVLSNGLSMLLYQALAQVRIFVGGDPESELPSEHDVLAAMRTALLATS